MLRHSESFVCFHVIYSIYLYIYLFVCHISFISFFIYVFLFIVSWVSRKYFNTFSILKSGSTTNTSSVFVYKLRFSCKRNLLFPCKRYLNNDYLGCNCWDLLRVIDRACCQEGWTCLNINEKRRGQYPFSQLDRTTFSINIYHMQKGQFFFLRNKAGNSSWAKQRLLPPITAQESVHLARLRSLPDN